MRHIRMHNIIHISIYLFVLVRFAQRHSSVTQLNLKPLFFEVPLLEEDPLFAGRQWLLHELESVINGSSPGILISGSPGTGKTALVLQLVEHSCFGRRREQPRSAEGSEEYDEREKQNTNATLRANIRHTNEKVRLSTFISISFSTFIAKLIISNYRFAN